MIRELYLSDDNKYLIMEINGDLTKELANENMTILYEMAERVNIRNFLIDLSHCRFIGSPLEQYEYTTSDMPKKSAIKRSDKFAFLVHPDDHSHDFVETVSRNTGYDVTLFRDREEAIAFLLKN